MVMRMVKKTFIIPRWILIVALLLLLLVGIVLAWDPEEWWLGVCLIGVAIFLLLGYYLLFPYAYRIDEQGLTLYYGFGIRARAEWKEIKYVTSWYDSVFPWRDYYRIGYFRARLSIHQEGQIPKTKKTTQLIQTYWHGKIG